MSFKVVIIPLIALSELIHDQHTLDNTGTENEIKPALEALTKYFTPNKNTVYETIIFREAMQEDHETVDQFCTRLRKMAKKCDFADPEKEIQNSVKMPLNLPEENST